jgi:ABC-type transport system substrate-binding protein
VASPEEAAAASAGSTDCAEDPNTCDSGDRADGGSITWIVNTLPGAWFSYSPEGDEAVWDDCTPISADDQHRQRPHASACRRGPTFPGGPYRLVEGDLENQVIKEPNDNWYGQEPVTLDTLVIRFINDEGAWVPALANSEVDGASPPQFNEDVIR